MLQLTPIQLNDAPLLYRWRLLDDAARENSLRPQHIFSGESHVGYICEEIARQAPWWIGKYFGAPIGTLHFSHHIRMGDKSDPSTHEPNFIVSICIAPESRGKGHGTDLLAMGLRAIRPLPCYATILKTNPASRRIFEKNNFHLVEDQPVSEVFKWNP